LNQCSQDRVQEVIESFAGIFCQKAEDEVFIPLQQNIFPAVAPVSFRISQVLRPVEFNYQTTICAQKVYLHLPAAIKWYRQFHIEPEPATRLRQSFQPAIQKCFAGATRPADSFGIWRR
jgi:hypothetical protein